MAVAKHRFAEGVLIDGYTCLNCEEVMDDSNVEEDNPLYECGSCGTVFSRFDSADGDSHRCPDCGKFGSKLGDIACPECGEGELEAVTLLQCEVCGGYHIHGDPQNDDECDG